MFLCLPIGAQNVVLSGQVTDAATGEPLIGVTVYNTDRRTGTTTNSTGNYTITLPSGRPLELVFSYVGYASQTQALTLTGNHRLDISLKQGTESLREVQVYGTRHNFGVQSSQMSAIAVSADQIRRMPALLGEADVLKSLQRLPGVQSAGDGKAGIHVRGGEQDQNLFTLDGITLYNPEHLQGFTSAINTEVMDDVVLYKGAFPARYGSRLSSMIDVSLREGDMQRHRLSITAGMLSSRLQAEGPLWKGRTSYNIAARVSYFSAIVKPLLEEVIYDNPGQMNDYNHMRYWDVNAKLTHRFNDSSRLSAVFYTGHDVNNATPNETMQHFDYNPRIIDSSERSETRNRWNNILGGLNLSHRFSPVLRLETSVSYSGYNSKLNFKNSRNDKVALDAYGHGQEDAELYSQNISDLSTTYESEIHDLEAKGHLTYLLGNRHQLQGGVQLGSIWLTPSYSTGNSTYQKVAKSEAEVKDRSKGEERYRVQENQMSSALKESHMMMLLAAHVEDDWTINDHLKASIGVRLQGYVVENSTKLSIEPRASLRMFLAEGSSIKASYARMSQGLFMLSDGDLTNPSDVWIPLFKDMNLGVSDQMSLGYNQELGNGIQLSLEGYYKWLDGVVEYRDDGAAAGSSNWADAIAQGRGKSYGVELLVQKNIGNTTWHVSYTWSKSLRTFDRKGMVLNGGREFYASGDRRHNFSISITQRLSKNWDFSAAWTYQSGRRATFASTSVPSPVFDEFNNYLPLSDGYKRRWYPENPTYETTSDGYYTDSYVAHMVRMNTYGQRNGYVLPAVHRLDISLSHHGSIGIGEMICDIGIYNVYNQQNISNVYWGFKDNRRVLKGVCMFPIMPSISLTLKL